MLYQCPSHISWAVEKEAILLIDHENNTSHCLDGHQAALWDLISRGYDFDQVILMMGAIGTMDKDASEQFISNTLDDLVKTGYLKVENE